MSASSSSLKNQDGWTRRDWLQGTSAGIAASLAGAFLTGCAPQGEPGRFEAFPGRALRLPGRQQLICSLRLGEICEPSVYSFSGDFHLSAGRGQ